MSTLTTAIGGTLALALLVPLVHTILLYDATR